MFSFFMSPKQVIRDNRSWIILAVIIFLLSCLFFFYSTSPGGVDSEGLLGGQMEHLQELLAMIMGSNPFIAALLIFMNNFISMVQMLLLGFFAGISPLLTLGINGALLGFISAFASQEGIGVSSLIIFGILPHGIFELSAFFLCGGLGLKFGYHCVASPLPGKNRFESFKFIWKEAVSVMPLISILLLAAAFIEIFVTPKLLEMVL